MTVDIIVRSHDDHSHEAHRRAVLRDEGHSHDVLSWSLSDDISKQNYWHNELLLSGSPHATIWRSLTAEAGHSEERRATGDHHRGRDDHFCPLQGDSFSLRPGPSWTRRSNRLAVDRRLLREATRLTGNAELSTLLVDGETLTPQRTTPRSRSSSRSPRRRLRLHLPMGDDGTVDGSRHMLPPRFSDDCRRQQCQRHAELQEAWFAPPTSSTDVFLSGLEFVLRRRAVFRHPELDPLLKFTMTR